VHVKTIINYSLARTSKIPNLKMLLACPNQIMLCVMLADVKSLKSPKKYHAHNIAAEKPLVYNS
jgi:hypothetical protein